MNEIIQHHKRMIRIAERIQTRMNTEAIHRDNLRQFDEMISLETRSNWQQETEKSQKARAFLLSAYEQFSREFPAHVEFEKLKRL